MDKDKIRRKWLPIIKNIIDPIELNYDIELEISIWIEKFQIIINDNIGNFISKSLIEFKEKLLNDVRYNIKVKYTYYNPLINEICYQLENGDIISNNKKYNILYSQYIINIFYSIVDPPLCRKQKISKILIKIKEK